MKLLRVEGQFVYVFCCKCHAQTAGGKGGENYPNSPAWYDADGKPFVAYYCDPCKRELENWTPACGGTETPFTSRSGLRLLYCWQQSSGRHAYINCDTDIALTDEEARAALATY